MGEFLMYSIQQLTDGTRGNVKGLQNLYSSVRLRSAPPNQPTENKGRQSRKSLIGHRASACRNMPASTGENGEDTGNTESPSEFRPTLPVFRPTLLRPAEAAKALGISLAELDRMHRRGDGPAAIKIHRSRRYSQAEIEKWINPVAPLVSELLAAEYKPGWVYFLQAENRGRIKIGYAGNLSQRIGDIRGASPLRLELVGCFPGSFTEEAKLHKVFRRWRSHYEWFEPNAKLLALISEINSALTAA